jgi:hypothetical protein
VGTIVVAGLAGLLPDASAGDSAPQKISQLPSKLSGPQTSVKPVIVRGPRQVLPPPTRTSCRSVVYIGDSTSDGETSADYIPDPGERLSAQLAKVGVKTFYPEISGARSIVETYENFPNGATVAQDHIADGFHGCWILALGTNDVADVGVGSGVGLRTRIDRMMSIIGDQPVLWIDVVTLLSSGPYAESAMEHWNHDLLSACLRYPNMRVYDWASHAKRRWFIPDGIHYYSPGDVARSHDIAKGLVRAFPDGRAASAGCLVRSPAPRDATEH